MRTIPAASGYQRGAALFMALVFLLILTLLGVFGMDMSRLESQMAGNHQFQTQALNDNELALRQIEEITQSITEDGQENTPGLALDDEYYRFNEVDTAAPDWDNINHATTAGGARYIVEYDNPVWTGNSTRWQGNGLTAHLFRITSQTTAGKGTRRRTQIVYGTDEAP